MRFFLFILLIIFFIACNNISKVDVIITPPEKSKTNIIKLADSLGTVTISLPSRYDTNFSWTHHSDCGSPCDKIKYRFQPKSFPINKESGWMWFDLKDSIESFTISHSGYFPFHADYDSALFLHLHQHKKASLLVSPDTYKIYSDTIEKIGGRYYSIFLIDLYDTAKYQYSKKILAATSVKGNGVEFNFELLTKQKDSLKDIFLENSRYFLRTVRINNKM
ncbi:hypothetical protein [Ferruginibacter sp.]